MIIRGNGQISTFEEGLLRCAALMSVGKIAALAPGAGLVEGGVHHAAKATFGPVPPSCGSLQKVSAGPAADLAGRYLTVAQLATRPVLRLVDRTA